MTLCVLAFASDGWVMGADCAQQNSVGGGTRTLSAAMKIRWDPDSEVAACFSGDLVAQNIADKIVAAIRRGTDGLSANRSLDERRDLIEELANQAAEEEKKRWGIKLGSGYERTVLVVLPSCEVWRIGGYDEGMRAMQMYPRGTIFIGDAPNAAIFFGQRYHSSFTIQRRTVADLQFLVAHCILEAHHLNSTAVDGLDILTYKKTGKQAEKFHLCEQPELDLLTARSVAASEVILKAIIP